MKRCTTVSNASWWMMSSFMLVILTGMQTAYRPLSPNRLSPKRLFWNDCCRPIVCRPKNNLPKRLSPNWFFAQPSAPPFPITYFTTVNFHGGQQKSVPNFPWSTPSLARRLYDWQADILRTGSRSNILVKFWRYHLCEVWDLRCGHRRPWLTVRSKTQKTAKVGESRRKTAKDAKRRRKT